jgi:hypothetical protein
MDIVERLRDLSASKHSDFTIGDEAADMIERLRQQNAELVEALREVIRCDGEDSWSIAYSAITKATGGE